MWPAIRSTNLPLASTSTPADLYVIGSAIGGIVVGRGPAGHSKPPGLGLLRERHLSVVGLKHRPAWCPFALRRPATLGGRGRSDFDLCDGRVPSGAGRRPVPGLQRAHAPRSPM